MFFSWHTLSTLNWQYASTLSLKFKHCINLPIMTGANSNKVNTWMRQMAFIQIMFDLRCQSSEFGLWRQWYILQNQATWWTSSILIDWCHNSKLKICQNNVRKTHWHASLKCDSKQCTFVRCSRFGVRVRARASGKITISLNRNDYERWSWEA